jgi:hypothetical protein
MEAQKKLERFAVIASVSVSPGIFENLKEKENQGLFF